MQGDSGTTLFDVDSSSLATCSNASILFVENSIMIQKASARMVRRIMRRMFWIFVFYNGRSDILYMII